MLNKHLYDHLKESDPDISHKKAVAYRERP